jgi:hypothetical protein
VGRLDQTWSRRWGYSNDSGSRDSTLNKDLRTMNWSEHCEKRRYINIGVSVHFGKHKTLLSPRCKGPTTVTHLLQLEYFLVNCAIWKVQQLSLLLAGWVFRSGNRFISLCERKSRLFGLNIGSIPATIGILLYCIQTCGDWQRDVLVLADIHRIS